MNQCDGCRRGLPVRNGTHYNPDGSYDYIVCTANRYYEPKDHAEACQLQFPLTGHCVCLGRRKHLNL